MTIQELRSSYDILEFKKNIEAELNNIEESIRLSYPNLIPKSVHLIDGINHIENGLFHITYENNGIVNMLIKQAAKKVEYRMYLEKVTGEKIYDFN